MTKVKTKVKTKEPAEVEVLPPGEKPTTKKAVATIAAKVAAKATTTESGDALAVWQIIERMSMNKDVDPDKLDRIIAMQERLMAKQRQIAFDDTLAIIQPKLPIINRNGTIEVREKDPSGKRTGAIQQSTKYAKYEDIVEAVTPVLGEHGFALRFRTGLDEKGMVKVVGILSGCGHREETEFTLQHDSTGSKNSVQAVVSSTSYGKRMAACALLNIVSRGEDDDGNASGSPAVVGDPMTQEQVEQLIELCEAVDLKKERFVNHMNGKRPKGHPEATGIGTLPASRFEECVAAIRFYESEKKAREDMKQPKKENG